MKKYLIRSGMSPLDVFTPFETLQKNSIGANSGNLIFAYSIFRNFASEEVEVFSDYYSSDPSEKRAKEINEKYDAYILPLANAFRVSFIPTLKNYTKLIKQLKIPVYVIGVGLQASRNPNLKEGFAFDKDVKDFVTAVLEKSKIIGVRGQITADYLTSLGFIEGKDHQVTGCPSMYTYGKNWKIRSVKINGKTKIVSNITPSAPQNVVDFLAELPKKFNNYNYIGQDIEELTFSYSGAAYLGGPTIYSGKKGYPKDLMSAVYKEGKSLFFLNAYTWIKHMEKNVDLSIGTRLHGNVTATLAGTPSITIPIDSRTQELSAFHNFATILPEQLNSKTKLEEIIKNIDVTAPEKVQEKNFDNFLKFLEKNNLESNYPKNNSEEVFYLDKKLQQISLEQPVRPLTTVKDINEIIQRVNDGFIVTRDKNQVTQRKNKQTIEKLRKEIVATKKTLKTSDKNIKTKEVEELLAELKYKNEIINRLVK